MLAKRTKMTFDAICQMEMKSEAKAAKKAGSNKNAAKWIQRANVAANDGSGDDIYTLNQRGIASNMPSSMR